MNMWIRIISSNVKTLAADTPLAFYIASLPSPISGSSSSLIRRRFSSEENYFRNNKVVEDLEANLKKKAPIIVKSYSGKRLVGCPGREGKHRHDVRFWLEKENPFSQCPLCSQPFQLKVVGPREDDRVPIPPFWIPSPVSF